MLEKLTQEQEELIDAIGDEYINDIIKPTPPDLAVIKRWLTIVYELYARPVPSRIEIADSPEAALALASQLLSSEQTDLDDCGIGDAGWLALYDYWHRVGVLDDGEAKEVLAMRDYMRVAWDTILLDECAIVVQRPLELHVDDMGNLHSAVGPCIRWKGWEDYAWHGTWVSRRTIMDPRSYSKEEYLAIKNTEQRRALAEAAGWDWVCNLLAAVCVDEWTDPNTALVYTLLRCSDGTSFLRKQSPPLKNGAQPYYIEPVHENLKTAQAARKWQATRLTPEECEMDPGLVYGMEA